MNLFDQVSEDIKDAMRAKDKISLEALRGIKKEFLEAKTAKGANDELSDEAAIQIIQKMAKQRRDSAEIYNEQSRPELAEKELAELAVLEKYLPKQLSQDELDAKIAEIIAQTGALSPADMGKVMGVATKALAGVAAGKMISETVKKLLSK
ncbi:GatB/YqeY domain-containing protein [Dysgonomonas sp. ZJ709]|uniref:GatB/YqeY domain-containing protein n=1 Tax=Dysgonomonas sp. ZJ709 TaxID=2709797 RepID=UPI0013EDC8AD|nr:GatB/YqeY domain-containing protein [Dysgonomonas sp. ZJ709]